MLPYKKELKSRARALRRSMTDAEQLLWTRLRRKQVLGVQFYRQKPLTGYIVDFYCAAAKLVVELDGDQHFEPAEVVRDRHRTAQLEALGLKVIRFDNRQVLVELEDVLNVIFVELEQRLELRG
ncbi:endonuclease domain-containing protein [Pseudomonas sp. gcc21]|uniref:endonuclease domain-containing protein n=1 Tax=Pseudomonas sp. gcc21 TaxID=2726989 RepID=UPI0014527C62|nr:endonuclease domain-containing protein [Pseudomonas sp. gcc21]QJD59209.1 endonuclease domain-containing protein [Pseudomonas sp. gcc21]